MNKKKWSFWIEVPGYLGMISLFLAIWIQGCFWRFVGTAILFWLISIINHCVEEHRKKGGKK